MADIGVIGGANRLEALFHGVLTIVITIMVLEVLGPAGT